MSPPNVQTDPFQVLDVPAGADQDAIKAAYLAAVRRFPPEREPERFKEVRAAYEALRSEEGRLRAQLFAFRAAAPVTPEDFVPNVEMPAKIELSDEEIVFGLVAAHLLGGSRLLEAREAARPAAGGKEKA